MVELTLFSKISLFLSSIFPMFIPFYLTCLKDNFYPVESTIIFLPLIIAPIIITVVFLRQTNTVNPNFFKIKSRKLIYIPHLIYIILIIILGSINDIALFIIIIIWLGFLYIKNNLFYINPVFSIMGYRTLEIKDEHNNSFMLLTKKSHMFIGDTIRINSCTRNMYLEYEEIKAF